MVFPGGRRSEVIKSVARACNLLLVEGQNENGTLWSEVFDYYGAYIKPTAGMDHSSIALYCLSKHVKNVLGPFVEMIFSSNLQVNDLETYKNQQIELLSQDLARNSVVAYREITEKIHGIDHPYGYNSTINSTSGLTLGNISTYLEGNYNLSNCFVLISGQETRKAMKILNLHLEQLTNTGSPVKYAIKKEQRQVGLFRMNGKNGNQTSIRIGRPLFTRMHDDFATFFLLNTLLGGYFGSRLMKNIREKMGMTYGIYSILESMVENGHFFISTEAAPRNIDKILETIQLEISKLQNDLIGDGELSMVKNYSLGQMLSLLDGPLRYSEMLKTVLLNGLTPDFVRDFAEKMENTTAPQIMQCARDYLDKGGLTTVIVT